MTFSIEREFDRFLKLATSEEYTIKSGDTFQKILKSHPLAQKEGLILQDLLDANKGVDPTKLQIGQKVLIPSGDLLTQIREQRAAPRASLDSSLIEQIDRAFTAAAAAHGVSEDILRGMAAVESGGNVCATSGAGAQGLMQLMPQVAKHYGVNDLNDPISSIWGAAAHLSHMIDVATDLLKYTHDYNIEKVALTMYNLGETAYREALRNKREMPLESLQYPDKVMAAAGSKLKYHCNNQNLV